MQIARRRPRSYLTQVSKAMTSVMVSFIRKTYRCSLLLVAVSLNGYLPSQIGSLSPLPFFWTNTCLGQLRVVGHLLIMAGSPRNSLSWRVQGTSAGPPQALEASQWRNLWRVLSVSLDSSRKLKS